MASRYPEPAIEIATAAFASQTDFKVVDFYVPLDQPLANVIAAALEPGTQSSYAANRVLTLPKNAVAPPALLPLYQLSKALTTPMLASEGD